jgi:nitroreductase
MMSNLIEVIEERRSVRMFDPNQNISKEELTEILELAGRAPSAWNLQHWHFMVFHDKEVKNKLFPIANSQAQARDASAVIAVLGDLQANKKVESVYGPLVESRAMSQESMNLLKGRIDQAYQNETYAREAAFSNASLAAMQLMLVAKAKGWDTCPMGGFDPVALKETFHIDDRYVPVMLIALGKPLKLGRQTSRLNVHELMTWVEE